jgi:hypothetical protein
MYFRFKAETHIPLTSEISGEVLVGEERECYTQL